jgi:uncharacterized protein (TIGR03118 family)
MFSASPDVVVPENLPGPGNYGFVQTNLVSNIEGMALKTDTRLVNPWDVNFPQMPGINPPVFVSDQGSNLSTSYQISPKGRTVKKSVGAVVIPADGASGPTGPTGLVQNTHNDAFFIPGPDGSVPATYIFDTLQGTIEAYAANNTGDINAAQVMVDNSSSSAQYTGLASGTFNSRPYIYAVNEGATPGIEVYNGKFKRVTKFGNFTDSKLNLPAGYIPYGIRDLSLGSGEHDLFVTYRSPNFQRGAVAVFANNGKFLGLIGSDTKEDQPLQAPWGLAFIQHSFGQYSDDLLVGNFSSGQIAAYQVTLGPKKATGEFLKLLLDEDGLAPLTIPGLRAIHFGPGLEVNGADQSHVGLLFTAETNAIESGVDENFSLYGEITPNNIDLITDTATGTSGVSNIL